MRGIATAAFGLAAYLFFFATFLWAIAFVGGLVPNGLDSAPTAPFVESLIIDLGLLAIFAVQHSTMARPAFKRMWTKIVPPTLERSVYVIFSSAALALLVWQWRPLGGVIWDVTEPAARMAIWAAFWLGWAVLLTSTFLINHFELFGLRQTSAGLLKLSALSERFRTPFLYRLVRHPLYLGFLIAFWAAPTMTVGHLVFAVMTTAYILIAIQLEEKDLTDAFGDEYRTYKRRTAMILPLPKLGKAEPAKPAPAAR